MMALGEAAGVAADLMVKKRLLPLEVPAQHIQSQLIIDDRDTFIPIE